MRKNVKQLYKKWLKAAYNVEKILDSIYNQQKKQLIPNINKLHNMQDLTIANNAINHAKKGYIKNLRVFSLVNIRK